MSDSVRKDIADGIAMLNGGNDRLGELLSYCLGRLSMKAYREGKDWVDELFSIDVDHVADWLKAAIIDDADWLKNVDEKNRPKKLMKFGTFEDIQKEADKAMNISIQKNRDVKLIKGDEEFYMELEGGYHLVKLLTPAALDREGVQMQHCVGNGAYDDALKDDRYEILSLRDSSGKPHATISVNNYSVMQLQGKQNLPPVIKYIDALKPYFARPEITLSLPFQHIGYVIDEDGSAYSLDKMPDGLTLNGSLYLTGELDFSLPDNLTIKGHLNLTRCSIEKLPNNLKVMWDFVGGKEISELPDNLSIGGYCNLWGSKIKSLPKGFKVGGSLFLNNLKISTLPSDIEIGDSLDLTGVEIDFLPDGLEIPGALKLGMCSLKTLPKNLTVGHFLNMQNAMITSLPTGLKVGGDVDTFNCPVEKISHDIKVDGSLLLNSSKVSYLPEGINIKGNLDIRDTMIAVLPENLNIGGTLYVDGELIYSMPESVKAGKIATSSFEVSVQSAPAV